MRIIRNKKEMSRVSEVMRLKQKTIGFVPTMGALHRGHLSLIHQASHENDIVVVSIFVNPIQFAPQEDFNKYPRDVSPDAKMCKQAGVDIIFYPETQEMYPADYKTYVVVEDLSDVLCGRFRSGHFRGVATVVTKLFNIIQPDIAYFGQKDSQQAVIIKKMVKDLDISIKIKVMATIRQPDGLALSSRNIYLTQTERKDATVLYQALNLASALIQQGNLKSSEVIRKMRQLIEQKKTTEVQYIAIVDAKNLKPMERIQGEVLIALAIWIGNTRLIDNIIVRVNA